MHLLPAEGARHHRVVKKSSPFSPRHLQTGNKSICAVTGNPKPDDPQKGKAWEVVQSLKCLLSKHPGLSSVPRTWVKSLVILVLRRQRQEAPLSQRERAGWPTNKHSLIRELPANRRPSLKAGGKRVDGILRNDTQGWLLHTHIQRQTDITFGVHT